MTIHHPFSYRVTQLRCVMVRSSMISMLNLALVVCLCGAPFIAAHAAVRDDDGALVPEGLVQEPTKPKIEPPIEADDEELLDSISPASRKTAGEEADRLERAINGMWNAKTRVAGRETGRQTQEIQNQV